MANRISKTTFPGKVAVMGRTVYIRLPKEVIDRMSLNPGDELDVTLELPTYELIVDQRLASGPFYCLILLLCASAVYFNTSLD